MIKQLEDYEKILLLMVNNQGTLFLVFGPEYEIKGGGYVLHLHPLKSKYVRNNPPISVLIDRGLVSITTSKGAGEPEVHIYELNQNGQSEARYLWEKIPPEEHQTIIQDIEKELYSIFRWIGTTP